MLLFFVMGNIYFSMNVMLGYRRDVWCRSIVFFDLDDFFLCMISCRWSFLGVLLIIMVS